MIVSRLGARRPVVRPPIGEPLAPDGGGCSGALHVAEGAGVVAKVELADVALEMLGAHVLVSAIEPALEDGEVVLAGVRRGAAAHILADTVVDHVVFRELGAEMLVVHGLVGELARGAVDLPKQDRAQRLGVHLGDVEGADPAAVDQGQNLLLGLRAAERPIALAVVALAQHVPAFS